MREKIKNDWQVTILSNCQHKQETRFETSSREMYTKTQPLLTKMHHKTEGMAKFS